MNGSRQKHSTDFAVKTGHVDRGPTAENAKEATAVREMNQTLLESMERYTHHLEGLIQRKNDEMRILKGTMALRIDEEIQKAKVNEHIMIHQARLAAMGELLGVVAHHWRQPLNVIALAIQNLTEAWEAGEFSARLLERTKSRTMEQIGLLSSSIDDFRGLIKPADHKEYFNPKQCLEEILALLSGWCSNYCTYEMRLIAETVREIRVAGCQKNFQQVILNLLRNADEALQEQRRRIGRSFRGCIEICLRQSDDVNISIANNGGGIDVAVMESIFDPHFTTKSGNNGFGIGLYLARIIIESRMNGSIWAENTADGALFGIRLPTVKI